jgi:SAM-dependent methyltransferase
VGGLPPRERIVMTLLALGGEVESDELPPELASMVRALGLAGVLERHGTRLRTADLIVVPTLGGYLLTGLPPIYASSHAIGASAYLGYDSLVLAGALPPLAGRRLLDLGAGCGVQGLLVARGAAEAVLTDVEPESIQASARNLRLNRTEHPVRILQGDLYTPVAGETFDVIVILPPYVPSVAGAGTSPVVDGGRDGLRFIRRLLAETPDYLAPGGEFVALAQLLCGNDGPLLAAELGELAGDLDASLYCSEWHPLQPYVVELASRLVAHGSSTPFPTLVERYSASLRASGATGVCRTVLRLRRPFAGESRQQSPSLFGAATGLRPTQIPRPAPQLVIGEDASSRLASAGGAPVALNGPTAALLAAVDGSRSIVEVVTAAWGCPSGAQALDLHEQAIERLSELARLGLVSF